MCCLWQHSVTGLFVWWCGPWPVSRCPAVWCYLCSSCTAQENLQVVNTSLSRPEDLTAPPTVNRNAPFLSLSTSRHSTNGNPFWESMKIGVISKELHCCRCHFCFGSRTEHLQIYSWGLQVYNQKFGIYWALSLTVRCSQNNAIDIRMLSAYIGNSGWARPKNRTKNHFSCNLPKPKYDKQWRLT